VRRTKKKVLITYNIFRECFTELTNRYEVTFPQEHFIDFDEVLKIIPEFDALSCSYNFPVTKELINQASRLKIIANYASGYDNIDICYAMKKGIAVTNTPNSGIDSTANLALGLILATARRITESDHALRLKKEIKPFENLGMHVTGQTLGILGLGKIGKALCKRARACGMKVIYHNRRQLDYNEEMKLEVEFVTFERLLAESDFLSLNTPLTKETYHIIKEEELRKMKSSAILINTARGLLVDEYALAKALKNRVICAAGLDVFAAGCYPILELLELENVILTPHIGVQTGQSRINMAKTVSNNIIGFFEKDRPVFNVVP
jgi:lactate dehydrogenase-like 2-hydroxyacid dehydrogenase